MEAVRMMLQYFVLLLVIVVPNSECKVNKKDWKLINTAIDEKIENYLASQPNDVADDDVVLFRGVAGNSVDPLKALTTGYGVTEDEACSKLTSNCKTHYRIKDGNAYAFCKIKYSLYKGTVEAAFVTFRAGCECSDIFKAKWFSKDSVIDASWPDLLKVDHFNYFSAKGDHSRQFFINKNYGGCGVDAGFTMALQSDKYSCRFDKQDTYPQFLYSVANGGKSAAVYMVDGYERADFVIIKGIRCK